MQKRFFVLIKKYTNKIKILQGELDNFKKEYEANFEKIQIKDFDIFGGISDDQTKVKTLHNEKHREVEKDKYKVLNITLDTELEVYIDNLRNELKLVHEAFHKINTPFETTIYIAEISREKNEINNQDNLNIANLNATEEIYTKVEESQEEKLNFYTLILPQGSPLLYYTNITQFDNANQTLPIGMDVTTQVLIDLNNYILEEIAKNEFRVNYKIDDYNNKVITVHAVDYVAKFKTTMQ